MKKVKVLYNTVEGLKPTQGYKGDFCVDIYASEGRLIPPLSFKSIKVPTDFRLAFDPDEFGLKMNLRSGVSANTPIIMSNSTGIVEGNFRDQMRILVRNTFIDNSLVDFAFTSEAERIPVSEIPADVLANAREFFEAELSLLGYPPADDERGQEVFKSVVPRGTVYIAKHNRVAQIHFQEKVEPEFIYEDNLPDSNRGKRGLGSSGVEKK